MVIRQGDVYWADLGEPMGSAVGYRHPHVVVQNDVFNESRLRTVVTCVLTSNMARAAMPGNVPLDAGEANLPKPSVVLVSQLFTLDKNQLVEYIGALPRRRIRQILDGIQLLLEPRDIA